MKKILILANNAMGLYNFRFELIEELIKQGYEIFFSLPEAGEDENVKLLIAAGAKHIQTALNRRGTNLFEEIKLIKEYRKIIGGIKPGVILTYTIKPNIYGTYVAGKRGIPVLINITGIGTALTDSKLKKLSMYLYKRACRQASFVFFQNESNKNFFSTNGMVDIRKTILLPGSGVNTSKFTPLAPRNTSNVLKFFFIGRVMREKGINEFLSVAHNVTTYDENVEFYVLGPIEEQDYAKFFQKNINQRIKYLGVSNDVRAQIREADCIVNPSYHEGMSNVLLEAASMGKPLIASDIPGCREIVTDGENGFLFETKSARSLEEKVVQFIKLEEKKRAKMGEQSRKKVVSEFDRKLVVQEYLKIIKKLI